MSKNDFSGTICRIVAIAIIGVFLFTSLGFGEGAETYAAEAEARIKKDASGEHWLYVNGEKNTTFTGAALSTAKYYYVKDGKLDRTFTGLAKVYGSEDYVYIKDGKHDRTFTGLALSQKYYYYVRKGLLRRDYTGPAQIPGKQIWYHVINGKMNPKFSGEYKDDVNEYKVVKGRIVRSVVKSGKRLRFTSSKGVPITGVQKTYNGTFYYAKEAKGDKLVRTKEGLFTYKGYKYYSQKGGILYNDELFNGSNGKLYGAMEDSRLAKSGWAKVGDRSQFFVKYTPNSASLKAAAILDEIGWSLKKAYQYCRDMPYKRQYGPIYNNGSAWCAEYLFDNKAGNCYQKSGGFYYLAKVIGYEGLTHVYGKVEEGAPHGWLEVKEGKTWYLFDPTADDTTHGYTGSNGWSNYHVKYGSKSTFKPWSGYTALPA